METNNPPFNISPLDSPSRVVSVSGDKKLFPSKTVLILIVIGILFLAVIVFFAFKFFSKKASSQVTLNYWGLFEPPEVFQQIITDYEKSHPNVKINYSMENLKFYRERLQSALGRKEGPDIFRFHQSWTPMLGNYLSSIPEKIYDTSSFSKTFYPSATASLIYQAKLVGLPLEFDGLALFYNEDLFRAAGKTPPLTWEELEKTAQDLTVRNEQGKIVTAGIALGTTNNVDHWSDILALMILQNEGNLVDPTSSLAADALVYYTTFKKVYRVWDETMPSSTYAFAKGNLAMYLGPSWRVFDIKGYNPNLNFKIIPVPQLSDKKVGWASFWAEGVSKNSPNQKEAWDFLNYLSSREILQGLYQRESNLRLFGEPYSRVDMAEMLKAQPYVSAFIEEAPFAQSWFLCSATQDTNGINQQIIKYYEDAVNAVNEGQEPGTALATTAKGVVQVLSQYGISR
ncbi:MAG: extracellular solute-binding protein [Patescibacteria group bacterium]|nr:extracellular solute-binding protein [Patescibacteria group bacterium]